MPMRPTCEAILPLLLLAALAYSLVLLLFPGSNSYLESSRVKYDVERPPSIWSPGDLLVLQYCTPPPRFYVSGMTPGTHHYRFGDTFGPVVVPDNATSFTRDIVVVVKEGDSGIVIDGIQHMHRSGVLSLKLSRGKHVRLRLLNLATKSNLTLPFGGHIIEPYTDQHAARLTIRPLQAASLTVTSPTKLDLLLEHG
ncbi:hypothetical protein PYCC9005_002255 [Savitreella phatthalungensis]